MVEILHMKYYIQKMRPVETILRIRGRRIKQNDGQG
jgi:hypothetical protein